MQERLTGRYGFDRRVVGRQRAHVQVPQRAGQIGAAQPRRLRRRRVLVPSGVVERPVPGQVPGAHEQHVAGLHRGALVGEARQQVVDRDRVGGALREGPALGGAPPVDVGEHRPPDDAALGPVVHPVFLVGDATVVTVFDVSDVPEPVPLRRGLRVPVVVQVVVHDHAGHTEVRDLVPELGPAEQRRVGQRELEVEPEGPAGADRSRRRQDALGRQQVERAEHVVVAPHTPRRPGWEVGADGELGMGGKGAFVHAGSFARPGRGVLRAGIA